MAFRVPVLNVSVVDLTVKLKKDAKFEEICNVIKHQSENDLKVKLYYIRELWDILMKKLSVQILFKTHFHQYLIRKQVIILILGIALNSNFVKLVSWYDNEWGYSNRILDLALHMNKTSGL